MLLMFTGVCVCVLCVCARIFVRVRVRMYVGARAWYIRVQGRATLQFFSGPVSCVVINFFLLLLRRVLIWIVTAIP